MNQFLVLTSLVFWCFANTAILADETLYKTQVVDGVEYVFYTSAYGATIVGLHKQKENTSDRLVFPKRLGGRKVTALEGCRIPDAPQNISIGDRNGDGRRSLGDKKAAIGFTRIVLPGSIELIGDEAFANCSDIASVVLPDSVLDIGYRAFRGCTSLTEINVPRHVETIKAKTFEHCSSLRKISFPESLREIESGTFDGCHHLTAIRLPDSLRKLGEKAFKDCVALETVICPVGCTNVALDCFYNCKNLKEVAIPGVRKDGIHAGYFSFYKKKLVSVDISGMESLAEHAFSGCKSLKSVKISENVRELPEDAFAGCTALEEVRLPKSLERIGRDAFSCCESLKSIALPETVEQMGSGAVIKVCGST